MPADPVTPFPFRTVIVVSRGAGAFFARGLRLLVQRHLRRLLRRLDVRMRELLHRLLDVRFGRDDVEVRPLLEALDLRLEEVARRQRVREEGVLEHGLAVELRVAADADLDVLRDRLDHLGEVERPRAGLDLILERAHEQLLARDAVEVGVRVPVADEVERLVAAELLVAGEEVDRGEAEVAAAVVEVAPVDVDPDAPDGVDELAEAAEVDRDQVVDGQPGQLADGLEGPLRAARRVGVVDPGAEDRLARAVDLDEEVARERHHRDRLRLRIGTHEHDRVGARLRPLALAGALVVADHESRGGLAGQRRDVEPLRRDLDFGRGCAERPRRSGGTRDTRRRLPSRSATRRRTPAHASAVRTNAQRERGGGSGWR